MEVHPKDRPRNWSGGGGLFDVIVADAPWPFKKRIVGGSGTSSSDRKYRILSLEEIRSIPISSIAAKDCVLFLWATVPILDAAMETLLAWGFRYKTMLTWVKPRIGMGFWFRIKTEHVLVGVRGKPRAFWCQESNVIITPPVKRKHSEKPTEMRELIERATPGAARAELFARSKAPGWSCWGDEIDSDFNLPIPMPLPLEMK